MKAMQNGPFDDVAKHLEERLKEIDIEDRRYDFLGGNSRKRDLKDLLARYPSLNKTKGMLYNTIKSWLHNGLPEPKQKPINITKQLIHRKFSGPLPISQLASTSFYQRIYCHKKLMGHLSSAYCVCFDHTSRYIFTGADDNLIKIWSATDGRLLKTLRGHDSQVCDMSVNYDNRLLASVGMDKIIRIWDLRTTKLLECLSSHSATVTSIKFSPYNRHGNDRYLISTSNDGTVVIWKYDVEKFKFRRFAKYQERNRVGGQITCSSMSKGGSFLACGSSDNCVHLYGFHYDMGPYHLAELCEHTDKVDSIQFCNSGFRFVTGSKDGTAIIWNYKKKEWKPLRLDMDTNLEQKVVREKDCSKPKMVVIVQWSTDDRYVITSLIDYSIKVWDSNTGRLVHILKGHRHDIFLIEAHPTDPRLIVSAGHDGFICLWDLTNGSLVTKFANVAEIPENNISVPSGVYDIKFSPDGQFIACTDCHGYLSIYSTGSNDRYSSLPNEMFFHTDYRPVIRDLNNFVMDENTHVAPHLMPRPMLVDMNGAPYPPPFQALVPDYNQGERPVIPPLTPQQYERMASVLEAHSILEDEEYIREHKEAPRITYRDDGEDTEIDSDATEFDADYLREFAEANRRRSRRSNGSMGLRSRRGYRDRGGDGEDTEDRNHSPRLTARRHSERLRKRPRYH